MDSSPKKGLSAAAPAVPRPAAAKGRGDELVEAVRNNDEASVSALLELGVSPNCQTEFGTPLIVACERGLTGLVQTLLARGADPNLLAKDGSYALRAAVFCGDGEVINVLLGHAATNMNLVSARGTPLVVASAAGDCETIKQLLDRGAELHSEARDGLTALHAAVRENQKEAVRLLLQRGARPGARNKDGISALDLAQAHTLPEVYALLMQASITAAADQALVDSEERQAQGREQVERAARHAEAEAHDATAKGRAETSSRVDALRAESEDVLRRLGLSVAAKTR